MQWSKSAVFPIPASPRTTSAALSPALTLSSRRRTWCHSVALPRKTADGLSAMVHTTELIARPGRGNAPRSSQREATPNSLCQRSSAEATQLRKLPHRDTSAQSDLVIIMKTPVGTVNNVCLGA